MTQPTAVVSGEGVAFDLPRAGVGSRIVASVVDLALQFAALLLLVLLDTAVGGGDQAAVTAVVIVEVVLVLAGYPVVCEWLTRGRTVGKLWLGLRVVRDDGGPIGFRHALVRGLASLVLEKPGVALGGLGAAIGLIAAWVGGRQKRLGDLLAGTFVLNERAGTGRAAPLPPWGGPPWLQPWASALDLTGLDDRLALAVRQFVTRSPAMTPAAQYALGSHLWRAVFAVVGPPPPAPVPIPDALAAVLAERRRRASAGAWPPPAGAWAPPPAGAWAPPPLGGWTSPPAAQPAPFPAPPAGPFTPPG